MASMGVSVSKIGQVLDKQNFDFQDQLWVLHTKT